MQIRGQNWQKRLQPCKHFPRSIRKNAKHNRCASPRSYQNPRQLKIQKESLVQWTPLQNYNVQQQNIRYFRNAKRWWDVRLSLIHPYNNKTKMNDCVLKVGAENKRCGLKMMRDDPASLIREFSHFDTCPRSMLLSTVWHLPRSIRSTPPSSRPVTCKVVSANLKIIGSLLQVKDVKPIWSR